jgi:hypothetical protein
MFHRPPRVKTHSANRPSGIEIIGLFNHGSLGMLTRWRALQTTNEKERTVGEPEKKGVEDGERLPKEV